MIHRAEKLEGAPQVYLSRRPPPFRSLPRQVQALPSSEIDSRLSSHTKRQDLEMPRPENCTLVSLSGYPCFQSTPSGTWWVTPACCHPRQEVLQLLLLQVTQVPSAPEYPFLDLSATSLGDASSTRWSTSPGHHSRLLRWPPPQGYKAPSGDPEAELLGKRKIFTIRTRASTSSQGLRESQGPAPSPA